MLRAANAALRGSDAPPLLLPGSARSVAQVAAEDMDRLSDVWAALHGGAPVWQQWDPASTPAQRALTLCAWDTMCALYVVVALEHIARTHPTPRLPQYVLALRESMRGLAARWGAVCRIN